MNIFITGAAGYIGGSIAAALAARGDIVRGLVRNPAQAAALRQRGITPVHGDLPTPDSYFAAAREAEIIINAADSDHAATAGALLDVAATTGALLIHTSGSSIVSDAAAGEPSAMAWTEEVIATPTWNPHPDKAARVDLDRRLLAASSERGARTVIVCNTMIVGNGADPARRSVQLPRLVRYALEYGRAPQIGRGLNRWSTVWIDDVVDLYLRAIDHGKPGDFVFAEASELEFASLARHLADALNVPVAPLSIDAAIAQWGTEFAVHAFGSNARVRGSLAPAEWGWLPTPVTAVAAVDAELAALRTPS
jgi:nucleoside-diphosphate-sugar epimerase